MDAVPTTAVALRRALEPLAWPARCALTARTAQTLRGTPELARLVDDLRRGDWYARQVALRLAVVADDVGLVAAQLTDGTPADQIRAAAAAVRVGVADDVLVGVVERGSAQLRRVVLRHARRCGRPTLADALLPVVRERSGDRAAARLLAGCSTDVIRAALPDLGHAVPGWTGIARRDPGLFLDHVEATVASTPERRRRTLPARYASGLVAAARVQPDRVSALFESLPADAEFTTVGATLAVLARRDPERVARLLTRAGARSGLPSRTALWRELVTLPDERVGELARTLPPRDRVRFLRQVPPHRRAAVLAGMAARPDADLDLVDLLPHAARAAAAGRELARREVAADPTRRRAVLARLPFADAEPVLRAATRDPAASVRAQAYPLLVGAAAATRDPEVLADVLGSLTRLPQDQDPVRLPALRALAAVPAERWPDRAGPLLVTVVGDAVRAPDLSGSSRWAMRELVAGLLRAGARAGRSALTAAGVEALTLLIGTDPAGMRLWGLADGLPRGAEQRLWPAFADRVTAEARVGRYATAIALASSLDRRAWTIAPLQQALADACLAHDDGTVRAAVPLWLGPPAPRGERVAALLRRDRTLATVHPVAEVVARHRTDLLEPMLRGSTRGRFLRRGVRLLPDVGGWWRRWTPAQVDVFVAAAEELARDTRATLPARLSGVRQLRGLPGRFDAVATLVDDPDPSVAAVALRATAGADDPARAVALLLTHLDSDRAREATPALRSALALLAPDALAAPLATMLAARKVTVRKEAVRLVVQLRPVGAVAALRVAWDDPQAHRDVRRAVAAVLPDLLDDPVAWRLLDAAVADATTADAVLGAAPESVAPRHRPAWAARIAAVAASADDDTAQRGLAVLATWARYDPASAALLVDVVADLENTSRWRPAAHALVQSATDVGELTPLSEAVARLLPHVAGSDLGPEHDAAADRDRPARRRLETLAHDLAADGRAPDARAWLAPLVDALHAEPRTADLAVQLVAATADTDAGLDLAGIGALCTRPGLVHDGYRAVTALVGVRNRARPLGSDLAAAEAAASSGSLAEAWLALAVLAVVGPQDGWSSPWRDVLRRLRRHDDPDLAAAAVAIATVEE